MKVIMQSSLSKKFLLNTRDNNIESTPDMMDNAKFGINENYFSSNEIQQSSDHDNPFFSNDIKRISNHDKSNPDQLISTLSHQIIASLAEEVKRDESEWTWQNYNKRKSESIYGRKKSVYRTPRLVVDNNKDLNDFLIIKEEKYDAEESLFKTEDDGFVFAFTEPERSQHFDNSERGNEGLNIMENSDDMLPNFSTNPISTHTGNPLLYIKKRYDSRDQSNNLLPQSYSKWS